LWAGFSKLSNTRLEDTVLAEFPALNEFVERARESMVLRARMQNREMCELLDCTSSSAKYKATMQALRDAGVLKPISTNSIVIARLYRPALQITRKKVLKRRDELADLRELVDDAVKEIMDSVEAGQGITGIKLSPLESPERKYIYEYVASKYADRFTVSSISTRQRGDAKHVLIQIYALHETRPNQ
jgi:hypothetical protein